MELFALQLPLIVGFFIAMPSLLVVLALSIKASGMENPVGAH